MISWFRLTVPLMVLLLLLGRDPAVATPHAGRGLKAKHAEVAAAEPSLRRPSRSRLGLRQPRTGPNSQAYAEVSDSR